jgi:monomeric sarcosine oxidase
MRVVVVGAGVFGSWTAYHLLEAGAEVTLVDAYGPGNSRSSSGDETRIVRCGYGPDALYSEMAARSLRQWRELDARAGGERLWHGCGVLWMAAGDDQYTTATLRTLEQGGYPCEVLDRQTLVRRFPDISADGISRALLEPDGGMVMARRAVRTLAARLERRGVRFVQARISGPVQGLGGHVESSDGVRLDGDRFVFACGAWLPRLFPGLLDGLIRPTRQVVTYFGAPPGDDRFQSGRWPAWIDFPAGIYGTPDIEGRGIKVGIDEHGPPIDPDTADRLADPVSVEKAREWLRRRVPRLAGAPVVETRVCQYENTSTGDFLIDRHPAHANVWIAGGGSGHGFKHGPAVGGIVAAMVMSGVAPHERFSLARKTADVRRAVF